MNKKMNFAGIFMLVILGAFFFTTSMAIAQNANFTGTWGLNEGKSNLGENRYRASLKITAAQEVNALNLERLSKGRDGGEDRITKENYTLDGLECENPAFQNTVRKSKATWSADGKILTINSVMSFERDGEKMEMKMTEAWSISEDGKTLTIQSTVTSSQGEMKQTRVYDKA